MAECGNGVRLDEEAPDFAMLLRAARATARAGVCGCPRRRGRRRGRSAWPLAPAACGRPRTPRTRRGISRARAAAAAKSLLRCLRLSWPMDSTPRGARQRDLPLPSPAAQFALHALVETRDADDDALVRAASDRLAFVMRLDPE